MFFFKSFCPKVFYHIFVFFSNTYLCLKSIFHIKHFDYKRRDFYLKRQLKTRLGEYREGAENSGLSHREVLLSLADHDQVPHDQTHREQEWSKEDDPEHVDTDFPAEAPLDIPVQE